MPTKKKTPAKKSTAAKKTVRKKTKKKEEPIEQPEVNVEAAETASTTSDLLQKIQCFSAKKKTICAHLVLKTRKCMAKMIANGRHATVNIGKKRRCAFHEETAYSS